MYILPKMLLNLAYFGTKNPIAPKSTVFFYFPGIVYTPLTHSIWENFVFFFHFLEEKKIQTVFYFFPGKVCKPLTRKKSDICKKTSKKGTLCCFSELFEFWRCIFFSQHFCVFFFFPGKVYNPLTHSNSRGRKKKYSTGKKKQHFHSLTRFLTKNGKS